LRDTNLVSLGPTFFAVLAHADCFVVTALCRKSRLAERIHQLSRYHCAFPVTNNPVAATSGGTAAMASHRKNCHLRGHMFALQTDQQS
jgi:hypothetical protein